MIFLTILTVIYLVLLYHVVKKNEKPYHIDKNVEPIDDGDLLSKIRAVRPELRGQVFAGNMVDHLRGRDSITHLRVFLN